MTERSYRTGPTGDRFDEDTARYHRARPSYPAALFEAMFERLPNSPDIVEVGPGTGQATAALVERGALVTAVEVGAGFVEHLARSHPTVTVHHGEFESVELPAASFDAVTAATAYHWVRDRRVERPHQLLRPGGWMAIIDLVQVGDDVDGGYFERVQPIYAAFGDETHDWDPPMRGSVRPRIADELTATSLFADPEVIEVDWNQTYTSAQYRDLLMTYSGTLSRPSDERRALVDQLTAVIDDEFDGVLVRPLVAALTLAQAST